MHTDHPTRPEGMPKRHTDAPSRGSLCSAVQQGEPEELLVKAMMMLVIGLLLIASNVAYGDKGDMEWRLALSTRDEGGSAETSFDVEFGGIAGMRPELGLPLGVEGRTFLAYKAEGRNKRSYWATLGLEGSASPKRGLSLNLRQETARQTNSSMDTGFAAEPSENRTASGARARWGIEAGYGLAAFGGRFTGTPHVALAVAKGTRDYTLGWRLESENHATLQLTFDVKATRAENKRGHSEHRVGIELRAQW